MFIKNITKLIFLFLFINYCSYNLNCQELYWEKTIAPNDYGFNFISGDVIALNPNGNVLISSTTDKEQPAFFELGSEGNILRFSTRPDGLPNSKPIKNFNNLTFIRYGNDSYDIRTVEKESGLISKDYAKQFKFYDDSPGITEIISNHNDDDYMLGVTCGDVFDFNSTLYAFTMSGDNSHTSVVYKVNNKGEQLKRVDVKSENHSNINLLKAISLKKRSNDIVLLNAFPHQLNISNEGIALELVSFDNDLQEINRKSFNYDELNPDAHTIQTLSMEVYKNKIFICSNVLLDDSDEYLPTIYEFDSDFNLLKEYKLSLGNSIVDLDISEDFIVTCGWASNDNGSYFYLGSIDRVSGELTENIWGEEKKQNQLRACKISNTQITASGKSNDNLFVTRFNLKATNIESKFSQEEIIIKPNIINSLATIQYGNEIPISYELSDSNGQILFKTENIYRFNKNQLPSGIYYLVFNYSDNKKTKKIIIQ